MWESVEKVLKDSQGLAAVNITELKEKWTKNKSKFVEIFGGEILVVDDDVKIKQDADTVIDYFLNLKYRASRWDNLDLLKFLDAQKSEVLYDNLVKVDFITADGKSIPKGSKFIKALKFFFSEEQKDALRRFQDDVSQYIQRSTIEGAFCLSVHPLDFLSISENTLGWSSCHSLDNERRFGNLNYIADNCTVVAYLKLKKADSSYGNITVPWNSKAWRTLLYFNPTKELIYFGKDYPYHSNGLRNYTLEACRKTFEKDYQHFMHTTEKDWAIKDNSKTFHFNDCLRSSSYHPQFCLTKEVLESENVEGISVGEPVKCIVCGQNHVTDLDTMVCDVCDPRMLCYHCDNPYSPNELIAVSNGDLFCECCYDRHVSACHECGKTFYNPEDHRLCSDCS